MKITSGTMVIYTLCVCSLATLIVNAQSTTTLGSGTSNVNSESTPLLSSTTSAPSVTPTNSTPATPTNSTPATPTNSTPATPTNSTPATPTNSTPATPTNSTPATTTTVTTNSVSTTTPPTTTTAKKGFPGINECTSSECSKKSSTDPKSVVMCCNMYRRCCTESDAIACPNRGTDAHVCSPYDYYCRNDLDCRVGIKCCQTTSTTSRLKCCLQH